MSIYLALLSLALVIVGILLFVMSVVPQQGNITLKDLWEFLRGAQPLHE